MKSRQEIERLSRQKQKKRLMLILLCVMVISIVAAVLLITLVPEKKPTVTPPTPPEILEGESLYNNYAIAYPTMQESQIQRITVTNKTSYKNDFNEGEAPMTSYTLFRHELANGKFVLQYDDKNGNSNNFYMPEIVEADSSFDYESLYSIETGDGYGRIYKLTYLCVALELPYFTDRINLATDETAKATQLRRYGLDDPQATITFDYLDENKKTVTRKIVIGDKNVTGLGYYFMVDDRPYIYSSMANYYDYAMLGFYSYVNSILVSAGLAEDSSYEPYLTTDYKQWKNETFEAPGTVIPEDSSVIIYTDVLTPLESKLDKTEYEKDSDRFSFDDDVLKNDPDAYKSGYIKDGYSQIEVNLSNKERYERFVNAIVGKALGEFESDIVVTLTTDAKTIDFDALKSLNYEYEIIEIEAILTNKEDVTLDGTPIADNNLIRVAYYLTVDDKKVSNIPYHGVIDLSNKAFDSATVQLLRAASVGKLTAPINLTVEYTETNSVPIEIKYVIDEIVAIYDKDGKEIDKITSDSQVLYRYCFVKNGEKQGYNTAVINLATEESENGLNIKKQLIGRGLSKNLDITVFKETAYCEFLQDYMTYNIKRADRFIVSELVSAFRFQNKSDRDPFYGESIYENTMDNEYSIYAINSSTCEAVAKMLGGIGDTTGSSEGLVGIETVAVGLTPEIKAYYELYAHTVYFELPRGIIVRDSGDEDTVDDYDQYKKLGFTLYISEEKYDTETKSYIRYVGSDLYDIVAKVDSEKLVFLNHTFVDFWARRSLMMFDINYLSEMKAEFMMDDVKGRYLFKLVHDMRYIVDLPNGSQQLLSEKPESYSGTHNLITVLVSKYCICEGECKCTKTKIGTMIDNNSVNRATLTSLYNETLGSEEGAIFNSIGDLLYSSGSFDTAATAYFREIMGMLYATDYGGVLTEQEQQEALTMPLLMRLTLKLDSEKAQNTSPYSHVYEFYRCNDRRVMVRLYEVDDSGSIISGDVTDFYVSTLAFKKIVANYFALLNGERIDAETAYPDLSK